jgi:Flp pilus assembly protein TadG
MTCERDVAERSAAERGSVLVEFVILFPLVIALALGILSYGAAHGQKLAMTNAAREAARYGATLPASTPNWLQKVEDVAVASATGDLNAGVPGRSICIALNTGTGWTSSTGSPCFDDGRPATDARVQVLAARTGSLDAFFFSRSVNLTGRAVVRFEANS